MIQSILQRWLPKYLFFDEISAFEFVSRNFLVILWKSYQTFYLCLFDGVHFWFSIILVTFLFLQEFCCFPDLLVLFHFSLSGGHIFQSQIPFIFPGCIFLSFISVSCSFSFLTNIYIIHMQDDVYVYKFVTFSVFVAILNSNGQNLPGRCFFGFSLLLGFVFLLPIPFFTLLLFLIYNLKKLSGQN